LDHATEALNQILDSPKLCRAVTVLKVKCSGGHELARVIQVNRELAYVARADHTILGVVEAKDGRYTTNPAPRSLKDRMTEHVEFLSENDLTVPASISALPAQCECQKARIDRAWLDDALGGGKKTVVWGVRH
jgi:hypothetical protein